MKNISNNDYSSAFIKRFLPESNVVEINENTYHYTSPEAFLSIIKNQTIRFTDIRFLNDRSEGIYLVKLMCDYFDKYPNRFKRTQSAFNDLIRENKYSDIQSLTVSKIEYTPALSVAKIRHFVFCTSGECDSLHIWNYYVNNGSYQGYNIGFNIQKFLETFKMGEKAFDPFIVYYGKVLYDRTQQFAEIENLFSVLETDENYDYISVKLKLYIDSFCAFFKNSKFSDEKEYRIVIEINDDRVQRINKNNYVGENNKLIRYDFCTKNGLVIPFLSVKAIKESISRITVSPIMEYQITQDSIRELLRTNNYKNCKVCHSIIPIRF